MFLLLGPASSPSHDVAVATLHEMKPEDNDAICERCLKHLASGSLTHGGNGEHICCQQKFHDSSTIDDHSLQLTQKQAFFLGNIESSY